MAWGASKRKTVHGREQMSSLEEKKNFLFLCSMKRRDTDNVAASDKNTETIATSLAELAGLCCQQDLVGQTWNPKRNNITCTVGTVHSLQLPSTVACGNARKWGCRLTSFSEDSGQLEGASGNQCRVCHNVLASSTKKVRKMLSLLYYYHQLLLRYSQPRCSVTIPNVKRTTNGSLNLEGRWERTFRTGFNHVSIFIYLLFTPSYWHIL